jgi:FMN phosphatase YigB (HAD superfamily)
MFHAVLFDLDNTLIDFLTFKKETAMAASRAMVSRGLPATEIEAYGKIFSVYDEKGIEYQKTFYDVVKQYNLEVNQAEKIQQAGILAYLQKKFDVLRPYPLVKPTLRKLRESGIKLAVVSDAPRNKAWQRLVLTGLEN